MARLFSERDELEAFRQQNRLLGKLETLLIKFVRRRLTPAQQRFVLSHLDEHEGAVGSASQQPTEQ